MSSAFTVTQLKDALASLGLQTSGTREKLKLRLKKATKKLRQENESIHDFFSRDDQGEAAEGEEQEETLSISNVDEKVDFTKPLTGQAEGDEKPKINGKKRERDVTDPTRGKPRKRKWKPKYHTFLITDVEATCEGNKFNHKGKRFFRFDYPNEIIEFPLIVLRYGISETRSDSNQEQDENESNPRKSNQDSSASSLETVATFHSYVRPTWRPKLSEFCKNLTGMDQATIDSSPTWPEVHLSVKKFLHSLDLLEEVQPKTTSSNTSTSNLSSQRSNTSSSGPSGLKNPSKDFGSSQPDLERNLILKPGVCWVTHGLCDLQDFVVKQSFISFSTSRPHQEESSSDPNRNCLQNGIKSPDFKRKPEIWLQTPILDLRKSVFSLLIHSGSQQERDETEDPSKPQAKSLELDVTQEQGNKVEDLSSSLNHLAIQPTESSPSDLNSDSNPDLSTFTSSRSSNVPTKSSSKQNGKRKKAGFSSENGTIRGLLGLLELESFKGRQHSGMDDCLNIERIFREVFRRVETLGINLEEKTWIERRRYMEWRDEIQEQVVENFREGKSIKEAKTEGFTIETSEREEIEKEINSRMEADSSKWSDLKAKLETLKESKIKLELIQRECLNPIVDFNVRFGEEDIKVKKYYWMRPNGEIEWFSRLE